MKHHLLTTIAAVLLVGCASKHKSVMPEPYTYISIHQAAMYGSAITVKQHLDAGANVNGKDDQGGTPSHFAVGGGHREVVELLITAGADVNAKDEDGLSLVHIAAMEGHKDIIKLIIDNGANVNEKNVNRTSPLHYAAVSGQKEIAELLLVNGADVNAKNVDGETPLDQAEGEIADLLRKRGGKMGPELKAETAK